MQNCPCGSHKDYSSCCGRFIGGGNIANTPEELMRSRYTAYTQANIAYIIKTMKGNALKRFDACDAKQWAEHNKWLDLTIINASQESDKRGLVEFVARYELNGSIHNLHEISEFRREQGKWYYIKGRAG